MAANVEWFSAAMRAQAKLSINTFFDKSHFWLLHTVLIFGATLSVKPVVTSRMMEMALLPFLLNVEFHISTLIGALLLGLYLRRERFLPSPNLYIKQRVEAWKYLPYGVDLIRAGYSNVSERRRILTHCFISFKDLH